MLFGLVLVTIISVLAIVKPIVSGAIVDDVITGGQYELLPKLIALLIIITIIAAFIQNFAHLAIVQNAFAGIRVCVCVLIFNAVVKLWKKAVVDKPTLVICLLVILGSTLTELSPIVFVILAAAAGIILKNKEAASK